MLTHAPIIETEATNTDTTTAMAVNVPSAADKTSGDSSEGTTNPGTHIDLAVPPLPPVPAVDGDSRNSTKSTPMGEEINLLNYGTAETEEPTVLSSLYINGDEKPCLAFTSSAERHRVHYCWDEGIKGAIACKGPDCLLCRIGRKAETRILIPLYDLQTDEVRVLILSEARTPHALLPQIQQALAKVVQGPQMLLLSKDGTNKFRLQTRELPPGVDDGAAAIQLFVAAVESGEVHLSDTLVSFTEKELRGFPWFVKALQLRGE